MPVCNNYGFDVNFDVCFDGAAGGGSSSTLRLRVRSNPASSERVFSKGSYSGSATFSNWANNGTLFGCTITDSMLMVHNTVNDNEVKVEFTVTVDSCSFGSGIYSACGGTGPFTLTGTKVVSVNEGSSCPF